MVVRDSLGGASGGTIASAFNIVSSSTSTELAKLANPFSICPRDPITKEPMMPHSIARQQLAKDSMGPGYDDVYQTPTGPWIMQGVNTRVVNRSNALKDYAYGRDLVYTERLGMKSHFAAITMSLVLPLLSLLVFFPLTRWFLKFLVPKQGDGPSKEIREKGFFQMGFWGRGTDNQGQTRIVKGNIDAFNGDPGYKQTAKMSCETALCIVQDEGKIPTTTGVVTPAAACDMQLVERLNKQGIVFS